MKKALAQFPTLSLMAFFSLLVPIIAHATEDLPVTATVEIGLIQAYPSVSLFTFPLLNDAKATYITTSGLNQATGSAYYWHDSGTSQTTFYFYTSPGVATTGLPLARITYNLTTNEYAQFNLNPEGIGLSSDTGEIPITLSNLTLNVAYTTLSGITNYLLKTRNIGNGSGTLTSVPANLSCLGTCYAPFAAGTTVTVHATASGDSYFDGWDGGGCSGSVPECTVTVNAETKVTARFTTLPPVRIERVPPVYYETLQAALNAATSGAALSAKAVTLAEDIDFNSAKEITITGGMRPDYSTTQDQWNREQYTTVCGSLTISGDGVNNAVLIVGGGLVIQ